MKKRKKQMHQSPFGTAKHAYLTGKPDEFEGKKRYKTKLLLEGDAAADFKALIDKLVEEAWEEHMKGVPNARAKEYRRAVPYSPTLDDAGEETATLEFRFAMNAEIKNEAGDIIKRKPLVVDARNYPIPDTVAIYSGSEIRVGFTTRSYKNDAAKTVGVTLDLEHVQVVKLAPYQRQSIFGEVEGGYAYSDEDTHEDDGSDESSEF